MSLFVFQEESFFSSAVQLHLARLTGMDYDRIFRVAKLGQHITAPQYQFLTEAELKKAQAHAEKTAKKLLQMPPVMSERESSTDILDHDTAIEGYDSAKVSVFGLPSFPGPALLYKTTSTWNISESST